MTSTRTIYREIPRQDLAITDAAVAGVTLLAVPLGFGLFLPVVIKAAGQQPAHWLIALAGACGLAIIVLMWRLNEQDKSRTDVYEESITTEPEDGVIGEMWHQVGDGQIRRANIKLHPATFKQLGVVMFGKVKTGGRYSRVISRDDIDTAMKLSNKSWAHDNWNELQKGFYDAGWVDRYGKVTSAFWAAVGLSPSPSPSTSATNEPPRDGVGG